MADVIAEGRKIVSKLRTIIKKNGDLEAATVERLETVLNKISKRDIALSKQLYEQKTQLTQLEAHIQQLQEDLQASMQEIHDKIPTVEQIAATVREVIEDQSTKAHLLALADSAEPTTEQAATSQTAHSMPTYSDKLKEANIKHLPDNLNRRTLVIRGLEGEIGLQINDIIKKSKYSTPLTLEKIVSRPTSLEVISKSETDLDVLRTDMRGDGRLNGKLSFVKKPIPYERRILLNVLEDLDKEKLRTTVAAEYTITERDFIVQREQIKNPPADTKNFILLMPKQLAQNIIDKGGLTFNFTTYKLRPHTAITRCQTANSSITWQGIAKLPHQRA